ncbi:OmpP1/FadL family transporter [Dyadobacter frigoris]|uniref:Aromatic hydrocarbon degradation protein n=1 Tax=Dyadobacter frigoris TaxID=2576211 RepID=A0A4U6D299_9BACT|nr:hypothetical protein [Dyadobacter frigoris]TKT90181.1 hypothetical protein FDK13_20800 [Dyadobacter frigoris]GLU52412.1 hemin receptor [Dyadobacter frigoris]
MTKSVKWIGLFCSLTLSIPTFAQYASDAFRYSEINQTGTARFQGLGGNHAALGGDASSISGNPAGLGFYTRSEFSISPSLTNYSTKSEYIGNTTTDGKTKFFPISNASLVITNKPGYQRRWKSSSLGISYSRQQSFQNRFSYSGLNNRSAYVNKVLENVNSTKPTSATLDGDFDSDTKLAYSEAAAYYQLFLINPTTATGAPYNRYDANSPTQQLGEFDSKGAQTQWNFTYAGNFDDKLYVGGSIGFNRIKYDYIHTLTETYTTGTVFRGARQSEDLTVSGNGVNATFGVIYKLTPTFQLGGSLTSPTFTKLRETFNQSTQADYIVGSIRDDKGVDVGPSLLDISQAPNDFEYSMSSPLRGSLGATVFINQKGFITGSLEYVGYGGMRVRTKYLSDADNQSFKESYKQEIQETYKAGINARLGGEYRSGIFRGRLGFAYLSDPYKIQSDGINRAKLLYSAGVGVRTDRFFADISGTYNAFKSVYTPYVLTNAQDYASAKINNHTTNVVLTVGTFF